MHCTCWRVWHEGSVKARLVGASSPSGFCEATLLCDALWLELASVTGLRVYVIVKAKFIFFKIIVFLQNYILLLLIHFQNPPFSGADSEVGLGSAVSADPSTSTDSEHVQIPLSSQFSSAFEDIVPCKLPQPAYLMSSPSHSCWMLEESSSIQLLLSFCAPLPELWPFLQFGFPLNVKLKSTCTFPSDMQHSYIALLLLNQRRKKCKYSAFFFGTTTRHIFLPLSSY